VVDELGRRSTNALIVGQRRCLGEEHQPCRTLAGRLGARLSLDGQGQRRFQGISEIAAVGLAYRRNRKIKAGASTGAWHARAASTSSVIHSNAT